MLTSRDVEILGWVARMGAVDVGHVMARFGMGRTAAYRRLAALSDAALVERVGLVYGAPSLFLATRDGLALTNTRELGTCRVTPGAVAHWRWSGWAALAVEREFGPERVLSDREVRAWEREAGERFVSAPVGRLPGGEPRPHRSDLAVLGQGRGEVAVVVEVELTRKARRRLEAILRGCARNRRIGQVRYYAPPAIARAVDEAAQAVHAAEVLDLDHPVGAMTGGAVVDYGPCRGGPSQRAVLPRRQSRLRGAELLQRGPVSGCGDRAHRRVCR